MLALLATGAAEGLPFPEAQTWHAEGEALLEAATCDHPGSGVAPGTGGDQHVGHEVLWSVLPLPRPLRGSSLGKA